MTAKCLYEARWSTESYLCEDKSSELIEREVWVANASRTAIADLTGVGAVLMLVRPSSLVEN